EGAGVSRSASRGDPGHLTGRPRAAYPCKEMAANDAADTANTAKESDQLPSDVNLINAGYVADLYELYRADPSSVDPEWRARFDAGFAGLEPVTAAQPPGNGEGPADAPAAHAAPAGGQPITGPAAR